MSLDKSERSHMARKRSDPPISWTYTPRIPPGSYPGYSRSATVYRDGQFKRWVCAVQFDILSSDLSLVIARLTWFLNLGSGDKPKANRRSNYWTEWVKANGSQPVRKDRLSPKVFTLRYGLFTVGDTTKTFDQAAVTSGTEYSVVRAVLRWDSARSRR